MDAGYPEREKFFAQKFHRVMQRLCIAQEYGTLAYAMLSVIVSQEDACRYRKPVSFWDGQLMPLIGTKSCSMTHKARKRLVDDGWLHYEKGHKGKASRYWVSIPDEFSDVESHGIADADDEIHSGYRSAKGTQEDCKRIESGLQKDCNGIAKGLQKEGYLPYTPNPVPCSLSPKGDSKEDADLLQQAADMSVELWHSMTGSKPSMSQLTEELHAKLHFLRANGRDETERIWRHIRDPARDKTVVKTINQMWKFWETCGIEEKADGRRNSNTAPGGGRKEGLEAPSA